MKRHAGEEGIGLVELLVAMGIMALVIGLVGASLFQFLRTTGRGHDRLAVAHDERDAFYWLNHDAQMAVSALATVSPDSVTLNWLDAVNGDSYQSRYAQADGELVRTFTVNDQTSARPVARNLDPAPSGFLASKSGDVLTVSIASSQGESEEIRTELVYMRPPQATMTAFPTPRPTSTFTPTPTPTDTPTPTPTFTPTPTPTETYTPTPTATPTPGCTTGDTGYLNPSANAADTGGGDGFELNPTNAYTDGSGYASNINGPGDRHRYYDYNVYVDSSCVITGIAVRLDWWLSSTANTNSMSVELSWDGGATWTAAQTDPTETTSEHTAILGGSLDAWGRAWTAGDLSDANFRVRLTSDCSGGSCPGRDFYLDWVPLTVYYAPATPTPTPTATYTPTPTPTSTYTPTPTPTFTPTPTPTFTPTPPPMRLYVSSYVGDNAASHPITGVGFQPDVVIIKSSANRAGVIRTSTMGGTVSKIIGSTGPLDADCILSLNVDGFTVGSSQDVNKKDVTYYYAAMKAGSDLKVGSYPGDNNDNRFIPVAGLTPVWVITLGDGDDSVFRPGPLSGDNSYLMTGTTRFANGIQALQADGFQVGNSPTVNELTSTYHYIAWAASPQVSTSSYLGNAPLTQTITGVGFQPLMAWVKSDSLTVGVWRPASVGFIDRTLYWDATAAATNLIQAFLADGFRVGTAQEVNRLNMVYYYLALRDGGP